MRIFFRRRSRSALQRSKISLPTLVNIFGLLLVFVILLFIFSTEYRHRFRIQYFSSPKCTAMRGVVGFNTSHHVLPGDSGGGRILKPGDKLVNTSYDVINNYSHLPRIISQDTKQALIQLLEEFVELLEAHNISYFMSQGMLLGSFFFHDLIPWDDDIDLFIDIRDINALRAIFRRSDFRKLYGVHSFHDPVNMYSADMLRYVIPMSNTRSCIKTTTTLDTSPDYVCYQQGKIYKLSSPQAGVHDWRYPFVDFMFYRVTDTHMYNHELWSLNGRIEIPLNDFYPFHLRPYNRLWIPAPKNAVRYLRAKFKTFRCYQSGYSHQHEQHAFSYLPYQVPCEDLYECYAHVRRRPATNTEVKAVDGDVSEYVVEELRLGERILQSVLVEEHYEQPHDLKL